MSILGRPMASTSPWSNWVMRKPLGAKLHRQRNPSAGPGVMTTPPGWTLRWSGWRNQAETPGARPGAARDLDLLSEDFSSVWRVRRRGSGASLGQAAHQALSVVASSNHIAWPIAQGERRRSVLMVATRATFLLAVGVRGCTSTSSRRMLQSRGRCRAGCCAGLRKALEKQQVMLRWDRRW